MHRWCARLDELAEGGFLAFDFSSWPAKPLPNVHSAMRFLRSAIGGMA